MDKTLVILGKQSISVSVRHHRAARRITLRLTPARDGIVMTLPRRSTLAAGMRFLHSRADWVLQNVEQKPATAFAEGTILPVLGQEYAIHHRTGRGVTHLDAAGGQLLVYGDPAFIPRRIKDFLKKHLVEIITKRADILAKRVGKKIHAVSVRDTRSRWDSCTAGGNLSFSWRLVFAPPEILDYLIAHEVAHLLEMSHSRRFWNIVANFYPDYAKARTWLRKEGHRLHGYG